MPNNGPRWFEQRKDFVSSWTPDSDQPSDPPIESVPELFTKCPSCSEALFRETLADNLDVCQICGHHFRMTAVARLSMLLDDPASGTLHDSKVRPVDALGFVDSKPYPKRIEVAQERTGRGDAFISVAGEIGGVDCELGSFDFAFLGGSMGSVVGEKITRLFERALQRRVPAIVISASGGARMQEGVLSLMQMAKTSAARARLEAASIPYVSILTDPTTGGVAASFAMLGDVILAEPGALIGFAGPRVIRETIGQDLPEGFQTAEYLRDHGLVDEIVPRHELKATLVRILRMLTGMPPAPPTENVVVMQPGSKSAAQPMVKPTAHEPPE